MGMRAASSPKSNDEVSIFLRKNSPALTIRKRLGCLSLLALTFQFPGAARAPSVSGPALNKGCQLGDTLGNSSARWKGVRHSKSYLNTRKNFTVQ